MIEKKYLFNNKKDNLVSVAIEMPWNYTSLAAVYSSLDSQLDVNVQGIPSVVGYEPISYHPETKTFFLDVTIDVEDVDFSEFEE